MIEPHPHWQWRWTHDGLVMPWFTRPCLEWLVAQNLKGSIVLEWGIGCDIPWWGRACAKFIGIDHDPGIGKDHQNAAPPFDSALCYVGVANRGLTEDGADMHNPYVGAGIMFAQRYEPYMVVVDGLCRRGCVSAMRQLMEGQRADYRPRYIIVDNAERPGMLPIRGELAEAGFSLTSYVQTDHAGGWTTDVWERRA